MEPFRDETELIAELRALRPTPAPAFAAKLDERVAAGFPRRSPLAESSLAELAQRLRDLEPRRLLLSTGATALAAIAIATVVIVGNESQQDVAVNRSDGAPAKSAAGALEGGFFDRSGLAPSQNAVPYASAEAVESSSGAGLLDKETTVGGTAAPGPFAANATHRDVERSAEVVLGADPGDVADDSAAVFDAVHAADGIVLRSSTAEGSARKAGASFDLLIPSAKLADALAALSAIDEVRSRHEGTVDITAPTVQVGEKLQDSEARIDSLLAQLSSAETESEREIVETELDAERHRAASLRSRLAHLHRRTSFSRVSVRIETGPGSSSFDQGGAWDIGDAFHDAGHILAIAAAVVLVALAVLGPIALLAALAWLAHRAWLRRTRERALG